MILIEMVLADKNAIDCTVSLFCDIVHLPIPIHEVKFDTDWLTITSKPQVTMLPVFKWNEQF